MAVRWEATMSEARKMRHRVRAALMMGSLAMVVAICAAQKPVAGQVAGTAQTGMQTSTQTGGTTPASAGGTAPLGAPGSPLDAMNSPFPDTGRQKRNDERQRRIVSDTEKLVALTSQLKAEVASTGAGSMSPEMLKQMEEVEKLAKSVKEKMRD